jgi:hypothetical protein
LYNERGFVEKCNDYPNQQHLEKIPKHKIHRIVLTAEFQCFETSDVGFERPRFSLADIDARACRLGDRSFGIDDEKDDCEEN